MAQRAVALPLLGTFLIFWIAALCRAKGDDAGDGYLVLDDGFPASYLQQHVAATEMDASIVTLKDNICLKLSAGLYSMLVEGRTLNSNPRHIYAGPRLRMPTTLRGEGLLGESRAAMRFSHGFSGKRFWSLPEESGDEPSSMEALRPLLLCRKRVAHPRCPPQPSPPGIPPPPPSAVPPLAPAPEFIRVSPPPPRRVIQSGPQHVKALGSL